MSLEQKAVFFVLIGVSFASPAYAQSCTSQFEVSQAQSTCAAQQLSQKAYCGQMTALYAQQGIHQALDCSASSNSCPAADLCQAQVNRYQELIQAQYQAQMQAMARQQAEAQAVYAPPQKDEETVPETQTPSNEELLRQAQEASLVIQAQNASIKAQEAALAAQKAAHLKEEALDRLIEESKAKAAPAIATSSAWAEYDAAMAAKKVPLAPKHWWSRLGEFWGKITHLH